MVQEENKQQKWMEEYLRQGEPEQRERARNWATAIGLQAVDGLQTSEYLHQLAALNIAGEIDTDKVSSLLHSYYLSKTARGKSAAHTVEGDIASDNINKLLSTRTLDFSTNGYINVHRKIFDRVFKFAGRIRDYDITKKEWVLDGDTVSYLNHEDLRWAIDHDIAQEKAFDYSGLSPEQIVSHIARFVAGLWQIHAFGEGNTRTTAVFTIQYLRSIGFNCDNDMFARHSWYFRNALVRANYKNAVKGINYDFSFLEHFFSNLLLNTGYTLRNRYMHINAADSDILEDSAAQAPRKHPASTPQVYREIYSQINQKVAPLIKAIGDKTLPVKEIMSDMNLKDRKHFMEYYLNPAIADSLISMLYPDTPRHPRQKYKLTAKGLDIYNELQDRKTYKLL